MTESSAERAAVMLDRDGTIIVERYYLARAQDVELIPGAGDAIRMLNDAGLPVILVTNQSGIGRGYLDLTSLDAIHAELTSQLAVFGARLDAILYCPHSPDGECDCRKPKPRLGLAAASQFGVSLPRSFVVGDKLSDILFGKNLGARTILVRTGYGRATEEAGTGAEFICDDLLQAARKILGG